MACHVKVLSHETFSPMFSPVHMQSPDGPKTRLQRLIVSEQLHLFHSLGNLCGLSVYVVPSSDNALCLAGITTSNVRQLEPFKGFLL